MNYHLEGKACPCNVNYNMHVSKISYIDSDDEDFEDSEEESKEDIINDKENGEDFEHFGKDE